MKLETLAICLALLSASTFAVSLPESSLPGSPQPHSLASAHSDGDRFWYCSEYEESFLQQTEADIREILLGALNRMWDRKNHRTKDAGFDKLMKPWFGLDIEEQGDDEHAGWVHDRLHQLAYGDLLALNYNCNVIFRDKGPYSYVQVPEPGDE